jgi:hypothetical protein
VSVTHRLVEARLGRELCFPVSPKTIPFPGRTGASECTRTASGIRDELNVKPAVGFTLASAGVTSFGFAQDRLCTRCEEIAKCRGRHFALRFCPRVILEPFDFAQGRLREESRALLIASPHLEARLGW